MDLDTIRMTHLPSSLLPQTFLEPKHQTIVFRRGRLKKQKWKKTIESITPNTSLDNSGSAELEDGFLVFLSPDYS